MIRKKPMGKELEELISKWNSSDHEEKISLSKSKGVGYNTMANWVTQKAARDDVKEEIPEVDWGRPSTKPYPITIEGTLVNLCDTHNPYQDTVSIRLVEEFLQDIMPDWICYDGDLNDYYPLSKFDHNPNRIYHLSDDISSTTSMFERHSKLFPKARKILIDGNHEDRLRRYLWTRAPELASLDCLMPENLFKLADYDITHIPYEQKVIVNGIFEITHGNIVSKHSGYTAKRMFEEHGGCGICGHCHRGGSFYKRNDFGTWGWWEGFCLCLLNPDYISNPNWVQGITLIHFKGSHFWIEQIPIINHTLMYGGRMYE